MAKGTKQPSTSSGPGSVIKRCTCTHAFQDERYGTGMRVANRTAKSNPTTYRCTVCRALLT